MSFSSKKSKTTSSCANQQDPWDETIPYLQGFLEKLGGAGAAATPGANADQTAAFDQLKANAADGNPMAGDIMGLAKDQLGAADRSGIVSDGYADLQRRLSGTADGNNQDLANNTYLQNLLTQVGDDAQNRVNAQFAAAGRDFSGANQGAVGRGVTQAQAPLLLDMFKSEQGRSDAAARDLFSASGQTAGTIAQLDKSRSDLRSQGIETTKAALEAKDQGANTMLKLAQQMKDLPYQDLAQFAQLLFPAAQLGQQSSGTGTSTTKGSGWGFNISDIGKAVTALGSLCDVRAKQDIERIGTLADGLPLYRWRYRGGVTLNIGPMAQDVLEKYPDAVREGPDGLLRIDLERATRGARDAANGGG